MIGPTRQTEREGKQVLFVLVAFDLDSGGKMQARYGERFLDRADLFDLKLESRVLLPIMVLRMEQ
jgi:hypothetical protein